MSSLDLLHSYLLHGRPSHSAIHSTPTDAHVTEFIANAAKAIAEGRYEDVLVSLEGQQLLNDFIKITPASLSPSMIQPLITTLRTHITSTSTHTSLLIAIAALQHYVSSNWTGPLQMKSCVVPELPFTSTSTAPPVTIITSQDDQDDEETPTPTPTPAFSIAVNDTVVDPTAIASTGEKSGPLTSSLTAAMSSERAKFDGYCTNALSVDGEDIYAHSAHPYLLLIARTILIDSYSHIASIPAASWWSMRCTHIYQSVLSTNSHTLKSHFESLIPHLIQHYSHPSSTDPLTRTLSIQLHLELAHLSHTYWQHQQVKHHLEQAQTIAGLEIQLTGILGLRTKFQNEKKAQLILQATSKENINSQDDDKIIQQLMPQEIELDSEVLLTDLKLDEEAKVSSLSATEQAVLLALCSYVRTTNPSEHETVQIEMLAYLNRLLHTSSQQHRSYAVWYQALYARAVLERKDSHKQDRALQQLEELIAAYDRHHDTIPISTQVAVRVSDVYVADMPPVWEIRKGMADTYTKMGLYKSALALYESMHLWDGIIESWIALGRKTRAEELLLKCLANESDPKWMCLLGDVTDDPEWYIKAWETTGHTYPRAQRALGKWKRDRKMYAEAIEHYRLALDINPVFPAETFAMGYCAHEIQDWDTACNAFTKTVALDPEYGDAWNNLAAAHIHLKNKRAAFNALEQAIRHKQHSWQLWENYMVTAIDIHEYQKSMTAFDKVVELKGKNGVDVEILLILTTVVEDQAKRDPSAFLVTKFESTLQKVSQVVPDHPIIWSALSRYYEAIGNTNKRIENAEKAMRSLQKSGWQDSTTTFEAIVKGAEQLVSAYFADPTSTNIYSGKTTVDNILTKAKRSDALTGHTGLATLEQLLIHLQSASISSSSSSSSSSGSSSTAPSTSTARRAATKALSDWA